MNLSKSWNLHIISVALYSFSPHGWQLWGHVRPVFIVWALWSIIFWPSVLWYFSELHTPNNMSWPLIYWWLFVVVQSLQSCPTLCNPNPMDCSMPGFPVLHHLPEFAQANVHWVGDAIQPSHPCHPLLLCLQSFSASGSFLMSQLFASGGQSIRASASTSVIPMNIQSWFPLGLIGVISLQYKGFSRVLKHQLPNMVEVYFQKLHNSNFNSYNGMNKILSSFDTLKSWEATF